MQAADWAPEGPLPPASHPYHDSPVTREVLQKANALKSKRGPRLKAKQLQSNHIQIQRNSNFRSIEFILFHPDLPDNTVYNDNSVRVVQTFLKGTEDRLHLVLVLDSSASGYNFKTYLNFKTVTKEI